MVTEWEFVLRIGVAGLFGGLLGYERELRRMPAGVRMHALVAMGAAAFIIESPGPVRPTRPTRGRVAA